MSHKNEQFSFNTEISTIINSKSPISFVNEQTKFIKKRLYFMENIIIIIIHYMLHSICDDYSFN